MAQIFYSQRTATLFRGSGGGRGGGGNLSTAISILVTRKLQRKKRDQRQVSLTILARITV